MCATTLPPTGFVGSPNIWSGEDITWFVAIAAIATNQVMSSPDQFFGDPTKPVGGNVVAHTSTYRVYFKKSGKKRIARMVDSPHHPEMDVIFALGEAGVIDPEDATAKKKKTTKKSEPKEVTETPDVSTEPLDSESANLE